MEKIAIQASPFVDQTKLEGFHEFLRAYTDIFTQNVHATKDYTYKNLKTLIENKDLVAISGLLCCYFEKKWLWKEIAKYDRVRSY